MFSFAAAAFMLGSIAVAVPVILHFMRRKPSVKIPFPSFYFLNTINNVARRNINSIKKWLVLFLRCMAILFICAAFALPFIPEIPLNISSAQIILIDASMSMKRCSAAETALNILKNTKTDTLTAVGCIGDINIWSGDFTNKKAELEAFIKNNSSSDTFSNYESALRQADAMLNKIRVQNKSITLISDMHRLPWKSIKTDVPLSPGISFKIINPVRKSLPLKNLLIENVKVEIIDGTMVAAVSVANNSQEQIDCSLTISVDKKQETVPVKLAPLEKNIFHLTLKNVQTGKLTFGIAALDIRDDLQADNYFYFPLAGKHSPEILLTKPENGKVDFLATALNPDTSLSCASIKYIDPEKFPSQLQDTDIIFLRAPLSSEEQIELLKKAVANGTGLVLFWDNSPAMGKLIKEFGANISKNEKTKGKPEGLGNVNFEVAPFKKFTESQAGNLYDIAFFSVPRVKLPDNANVLAEFSNGTPALAEFPCGKGNVYLFSFSTDRNGSDWPVRATFLPFWHELIKQFNIKHNNEALIKASFKPFRQEGLRYVRKINHGNRNYSVKDKSFIPAEAGVYILESDADKKILCVNHSNEEAEITYEPDTFRPDEFLVNKNKIAKSDESNKERADAANGKNLFAACFIIALLCGLAEMLIANRTAL